MLRVTVVLFSMLCVGYAWQDIQPLEVKPEKFKNVPGCYIKDLDQVIPFEKPVPSRNSCMGFSCSGMFVTYSTCSMVLDVSPSRLVEDKTKPFPDCCPRPRKNYKKL